MFFFDLDFELSKLLLKLRVDVPRLDKRATRKGVDPAILLDMLDKVMVAQDATLGHCNVVAL